MLDKIKSGLNEHEEILFELKPNKKRYKKNNKFIALVFSLFPMFIIVGLLKVTEADVSVNGESISDFNIFMYKLIIFLAVSLISFLIIRMIVGISRILNYRNIFYVITTQRVIRSSGVITNQITNRDYTNIGDIKLFRSILDKKTETGTLLILTKGEEATINMSIANIDNPELVYNKLKEVALDVKSDIYYPNENRN